MCIRDSFQFNADAEISIEVDPREIELDVLDHLRAEGFNRLSMGVQAVSYTHLDVYKRQSGEWSLIAESIDPSAVRQFIIQYNIAMQKQLAAHPEMCIRDSLVREDRSGRITGVRVVMPMALPGS